MIGDCLFLLAQASLCLFGAGAAFHTSVRSFSVPARLSVALAAGTVALTIEATIFSTVGIRWSIAALGVPLLALSGLLAMRLQRQESSPDELGRDSSPMGFLPKALTILGFGYLALSLASSASTSVDYLLFWGVKAVRFAEARGIDTAFLRNFYSYHAVPDYPPLVPIVQAWGVLAGGKMPWRLVPLLTIVWPVAAAAVVFDIMRKRVGQGAAAVGAFWSVALAFSLAYSYSGGNAEGPLLFFETTALAFLLTESPDAASRFVPALALCGACLTKVEGTVAAALIVFGTLARDRLLGYPRALARTIPLLAGPVLGLAIWFVYQRSAGLPVGYRPHGEFLHLHPEYAGSIARNMLAFLNAGTEWLAWIVPLVLLIAFSKRWKSFLPALVLAVGLIGFLAFDYLHDADDPATRISWTLPRVSQPALSAVILAAGLASLEGHDRDELS